MRNQKTSNPRIIIIVNQGVVTDIYSDTQKLNIDILDHDPESRGEDDPTRTKRLEKELKKLVTVPFGVDFGPGQNG